MANFLSITAVIVCFAWNSAVYAQSLVNALQQSDANVFPLIAGRMDMIGNAYTFVGSVTLVRDTGLSILVDTPTATDIAAKTQLSSALKYKGLKPAQIDMVVITHGHPDHYGQDGAFPNAQHFFNDFVYTDNKFTKTEFTNGELQITPNVKLWQTPGHTPQDISVIVSNVPGKGTVAIVGDLILSADDLSNSNVWEQTAWNVEVGLKNRKKVVCIANHVVPGHSRPFVVTPQMKSAAQCGVEEDLISFGSLVSTVTLPPTPGMMKLYPGSSAPLRCFSNSDCAQFPEFTNCVQSARFNSLVCCSTKLCL